MEPVLDRPKCATSGLVGGRSASGTYEERFDQIPIGDFACLEWTLFSYDAFPGCASSGPLSLSHEEPTAAAKSPETALHGRTS